MGFPFTYSGSFSLRSVEHGVKALDECAEQLDQLRAKKIVRDELRLDFKGGPFRLVDNWNLLVPIGRGSITVFDNSQPVLVFQLNFVSLFVIVSVGTALVFGSPITFDGELNPSISIATIVGWMWLVGGNYVLTVRRFRKFIADIVSNVPRRQTEPGETPDRESTRGS